MRVTYAHLEVVRQALGNCAQAGRKRVVPVLHVVRFGQSAGPAVAHHVAPLRVFDYFRGFTIDRVLAPALGHADTVRVPQQNTLRLDVDVRPHQARPAVHELAFVLFRLPGVLLAIVIVNSRHRKPRIDVGRDARSFVDRIVTAVTKLRTRHFVGSLGKVRTPTVTAAAVSIALRPDRRDVDRTVRHRRVRTVTIEAEAWELPVRRDAPLGGGFEELHPIVLAVGALEAASHHFREWPEVVLERRRFLVPGGPDGTVIVAHLRDLVEAPLALVQAAPEGCLEVRYPDQTAIGVVTPAMERAGEHQCIAVVIAAHLHTAMAARVQKDMDIAPAIAAQDDLLFTHARDDEVAGLVDLTLMPDEQPGTREDLLQLLLVDALIDVNFATDEAFFEVHQFPN